MDDIETIKKVHKLKKVGFNSLQVSNRLGLDLGAVNKMFDTRIPDPRNKKVWVKYTRYDDKNQKKEASEEVSNDGR